MRVTITSVADFHRLAVPAYSELVASAGAGRPRLEVEFAPGIYQASGLTLGEPPSGHAIDLDLHAADPRQPPRLVDMTLALHGRRIRLADLVFETASGDRPLLRVTIEHAIELDHCAFLGNRTGPRAGDRLLELVARSGSEPAQASFRASWFIHNSAPPDSTLVAFDARAPHAFGRILFQDVAFLANDAACGVAPGNAAAVDVHRCVVVEPAEPVDEPSPPFIAVTSPRTRVEVGDSLIVRRSLAGFVSRWSVAHPAPVEYEPVRISDSRLLSTEARPAAAGYLLARSPVEPARGAFEHLARVVAELVIAARDGARPNVAELAQQLAPPADQPGSG
jgi:hypothetical protein